MTDIMGRASGAAVGSSSKGTALKPVAADSKDGELGRTGMATSAPDVFVKALIASMLIRSEVCMS